MTIVKLIDEAEASDEIKAIYDDIKKTFRLPVVPTLFKAMAHHPTYLAVNWQRIKVVLGPGKLDRKTKEAIAVAVSAVNGCRYCIDAHTAALRGLGFGDAELTELMTVVDLFSGLNKFIEGLRIESDLGA